MNPTRPETCLIPFFERRRCRARNLSSDRSLLPRVFSLNFGISTKAMQGYGIVCDAVIAAEWHTIEKFLIRKVALGESLGLPRLEVVPHVLPFLRETFQCHLTVVEQVA